MNTKIIMIATAVTLGILGLGMTFAPGEAANFMELESSSTTIIVFQLLGALYFSFAMTNWSIKDGRIGGIYNRPIALGNLTHFLIGGMAICKALFSDPELPILIWILGGFYILFAVFFWIITFTHPKD